MPGDFAAETLASRNEDCVKVHNVGKVRTWAPTSPTVVVMCAYVYFFYECCP